MDINKIFGMFNDKDPDFSSMDDHYKKLLDGIGDTPSYKLGMFKKIITYNGNFGLKLKNIFQGDEEVFDSNKIEEVSELLTFNRAWDYIRFCDLDDISWRDAIETGYDEYLTISLKLSISFFEDYEEYEKCSFLKKIETFLENSLAPKN
jgi:hypothetical protein